MITEDEFDPFAHLDMYQKPDSSTSAAPIVKPMTVKPADRHPCLECDGTGYYKGVRIHQEKTHCFACKGKGYFKKSFADRQKARGQAKARKVKKLDDAKAAFSEANAGLIEGLQAIASWHGFAASMLANFDKWGSLTDKQITAAWASLAKVEAKRAEREAAKLAKSGDVDVTAIRAMFDNALSKGLRFPVFKTERLNFSLASATSRNPGAIYVKCDGEYAGKIADGKFTPANNAPADILDLVRAVAASPIGAAREYGRITGRCSCCGRTLSNKESIELGIGPICATKWGI